MELMGTFEGKVFHTFADKEPLSIFSNPRASTQSARPGEEKVDLTFR